MSRFLFLPMPAHGHVNPTLAVAAHLVRSGHRVDYVLPEQFRAAVAPTGAGFVGYAPPPFPAQLPGGAHQHLAVLMERVLATAEVLAEPLLELYDRTRPDLVVAENFSVWGKLLAAARSARSLHVATSYPPGPQSPVARLARAAGLVGGLPADPARLAAVAARYGAPGIESISFEHGGGVPTVVFMPAEFHPDAGALGPDVHFVGPTPDRPEPDAGIDLAAWEKTPGVYVSLGTVFNESPEFFRACLAAFGGRERPVLVNHGPRLGAADFPDVPDGVTLAPYVPQLRVLDRSAVFVTHGGMGGTMEAVVRGVPMVVVPQMIDQEATAERVAELGLGVRLDPADATADALADAVATVTKDPSYREACLRMGAAARAAGGPSAAADILVAAAG